MAKRKVRSDGRYQGKVLVGMVDGRYKYKYVYAATKQELEAKLAELRVQVGRGAPADPARLTFRPVEIKTLKFTL